MPIGCSAPANYVDLHKLEVGIDALILWYLNCAYVGTADNMQLSPQKGVVKDVQAMLRNSESSACS